MGDNWELKQKVDEIHILLERCDTYEARIAELERERDTWIGNCSANDELFKDCMKTTDDLRAELARVKAESLRVVEDGEPVGLDAIFNSKLDFRMNYMMDGEPVYNDGISMRSLKCHEFVAIDDVEFIPVRLERWETEE